MIDCYPHVALLTLLKRDYRVPYEVSRSGKYWKAEKLTRSERIERLLEQFQAIKTGLNKHISGIPDFIPAPYEVSTAGVAQTGGRHARWPDLRLDWHQTPRRPNRWPG